MNSDASSKSTIEPSSGSVNCYGCTHFAITWARHFPYACKKMEFRSKRLPCDDVLEADGQPCLARMDRTDVAAPKSIQTEITDKPPKPAKGQEKKKTKRIGSQLNLSV